MELRPIAVKEAMGVVARLHRHLPRVVGARHAVSAWKNGRLVGVALIANPIARLEAREWDIAEITRVATDGTRNAGSFLYAHAKRAAQALGYRRVRTKTLPCESGASLRAVRGRQIGVTRAQSWDRENRRREQLTPVVQKLRWEL